MNNFLTTLSQGDYNLTNEALGFLAKQEKKIPNDSCYKPVHAAFYVGATFVVASANLADILIQTIYTMGKFVPAIFITIGNRFTDKPRFEDCTLGKVFVHFTRIPKALLKLIPIAAITLFAGPTFAQAYSQRNEKANLEISLKTANESIAKLQAENEKLLKSQKPQNTHVPAQPGNLDDLNGIGAMKNEIESKSKTIDTLENEKKILERDLKKAKETIDLFKRQIEELQKTQNPQNPPVNPGPMNRGGRGGPPPSSGRGGPPPPPSGTGPKVPGQTKINVEKKDPSEKGQVEMQQDKKKEKPAGLTVSMQDITGVKLRKRSTDSTPSKQEEKPTEAQQQMSKLRKTENK